MDLSAKGVLANFIDDSGNVRTDIASVAGKLIQSAKSNIGESIRTQLPHAIQDEVITQHFRSLVQQSGDKIIQAIRNKSGDIVNIINQSPSGTYIKGENILLDGNVRADNVFVNNLMTKYMTAEAVTAFTGRYANLITNELTANSAVINRLRANIITSDSLRAYEGWIGGFKIGTQKHGNETLRWITGENEFRVGMGDGKGYWRRVVLWVNWGQDWNNPGQGAWYVENSGQMFANALATFKGGVDISSPSANSYKRPFNCYVPAHLYYDVQIDGDLTYTNKVGEHYETAGYYVYSPKNEAIRRIRFSSMNFVVGVGTSSGNLTEYAVATNFYSDKRLKRNIAESNVDALDALSKLKTYEYDINTPQGDFRHAQLGIIAQEVAEHIPDAHQVLHDGYETYDTFHLSPYLIKAIQQLNEKIDSLEVRMNG